MGIGSSVGRRGPVVAVRASIVKPTRVPVVVSRENQGQREEDRQSDLEKQLLYNNSLSSIIKSLTLRSEGVSEFPNEGVSLETHSALFLVFRH